MANLMSDSKAAYVTIEIRTNDNCGEHEIVRRILELCSPLKVRGFANPDIEHSRDLTGTHWHSGKDVRELRLQALRELPR